MKQCDGELNIRFCESVLTPGSASIYRIPLQSPSVLLRDIKANATSLDSLLDDVEIKHPLVSAIFFPFHISYPQRSRHLTSLHPYDPQLNYIPYHCLQLYHQLKQNLPRLVRCLRHLRNHRKRPF